MEENFRATAPTESTAATPAIFLTVSGKRGSDMTKEQLQREKRYLLALSIAKSMLLRGVIDDSDLQIIEAKLMEKFHPVREGLRSKKA